MKRMNLPVLTVFLSSLSLAGFQPETVGYVQCPSFLFPADINEDGRTDILCSSWDDSSIVFFENLPSGWEGSLISDNLRGATSVCAADINGDGIMDIAGTAWEDGKLICFLGNVSGGYDEHTVHENLPMAHEVTACDVNGDGRTDLITAVAGLNRISIWLNQGGSIPGWIQYTLSASMGGARSVCYGDFDQNGTIDIAGAALGSNSVRWWSNNGEQVPTWTEHQLTNSLSGAHMVRCGYLDSDSIPDIAAVGYYSSSILIWLSSQDFNEFEVCDDFSGGLGICLQDLDNDGRTDISATSETRHTVRWWRNTGFLDHWPWWNVDSSLPGAWPIVSGDFNDDGWYDLSSGASFGEVVRCYINDRDMGIDQGSQDSYISITPNPCRHSAQIAVNNLPGSSRTITVHDTAGRMIHKGYLTANNGAEYVLATENVPAGIYILTVDSGNGSLSRLFSVLGR